MVADTDINYQWQSTYVHCEGKQQLWADPKDPTKPPLCFDK
jgi:hypothetical protein